MKRSRPLWIIALVVVPVLILGFLFATGKRGFFKTQVEPRSIEVTRLPIAETKRLGWRPAGLDALFRHAATLSTDVMMIVTDGQVVGAFGDLERRYKVHSIRKAFLSALVGQHVGNDDKQILLEATLEQLGIDDVPKPLIPFQKQATVLHLLKSISGINHPAAADAGLVADKNRRLGTGENKPGTIWAYNNWDYNALTTIFERRTGMSVAEAFDDGIARPLGMLDFTPDAVSYSADPNVSRHRAAMFRMSPRDLARFGELYLHKGMFDGKRILPESWIDRITADLVETDIEGLRAGHGYLWWVPSPNTGLPKGSFFAWGIGQQTLLIIPEWKTVIVHLADMTEFFLRFFRLIEDEGMVADKAFEQIAFSCFERANRKTEFCVEHRFILRREFSKLISLLSEARR